MGQRGRFWMNNNSQIQAGWIITGRPKASGPQHSDLVSEVRVINPRPVGQTTACIPKSHIQWFPFLLLQKIKKKIKGFLLLLLLLFMIISENNHTSSFGQVCLSPLAKGVSKKKPEACMECLTTRVRSHQP